MKIHTKSIIAVLMLVGLSACAPKDYSKFESGVITPEKLASYVDNWQATKPKGTKGRLVIFQAGATSLGKFIKHDDTNVSVYQIPGGGSCDPSYKRHDGIANIPGALLSGPYVDGMINMFDLNPEEDYVVFAVGEGSTGIREIVRSWWVLTYWGWPKDRLAFLNGSVSYDFSENSGLADYLVDSGSPMPAAPSNYSMKTLNNVQTHLQTYLAEMMQIAAKNDKSKYFIADARGTKEYTGAKNSRAADMNCGPHFDEQCHVPLQGHIRGAVDFPYTDLLIMDDQKEDINGDGKIDKKDASFKFKSPTDLEAYYSEKGYKPNQKIVTYCRTGRKATLVTLTASAILDYPVSMYDGSWIQWGEMANRRDVTGNEILPAGSHLNLDDPKYSVVTKYIEPQYTQAGAPYEINLNATKSDKIIEEDKAYMK